MYFLDFGDFGDRRSITGAAGQGPRAGRGRDETDRGPTYRRAAIDREEEDPGPPGPERLLQDPEEGALPST